MRVTAIFERYHHNRIRGVFVAVAAVFAIQAAAAFAIVHGARGTTTRIVASRRYHYSIAVPAGWRFTAAKATVAPTAFPTPLGPETDVLLAPTGADTLGIASVKLAAGGTRNSWVRTTTTAITNQFACFKPARTSRTLDATSAAVLTYKSCVGNFFIVIASVHGGRGYDVFWISPPGKTIADRATFYRMISSFRFTS